MGSVRGGGRKARWCGCMARCTPTPVNAASRVTSPPIRASFQGGRIEDSSNGSADGNACHPYTYLYICQDEKLARGQGFLQRLTQAAQMKFEPGRPSLRR